MKDQKSIPLQLRDRPTVAAAAALQWAGEKYIVQSVEKKARELMKLFYALDIFKKDMLFSLCHSKE